MSLEYIPSLYGNPMLKWEGHLFMREKLLADGRTAWKCIGYNDFRCLARAITKSDKVIDYNADLHNHFGDRADIIARELVGKIKERAVLVNDSPSKIIADVTAGASVAVAGRLPDLQSLKRSISRIRQRKSISLTKSVELQLPDKDKSVNSIAQQVEIATPLPKATSDQKRLVLPSNTDSSVKRQRISLEKSPECQLPVEEKPSTSPHELPTTKSNSCQGKSPRSRSISSIQPVKRKLSSLPTLSKLQNLPDNDKSLNPIVRLIRLPLGSLPKTAETNNLPVEKNPVNCSTQ